MNRFINFFKAFPLTVAWLFFCFFYCFHVFFLPIVLTWDSQLYIQLSEILFSPGFLSQWDFARGPLFPLGIWLCFQVFGKTPLSLIIANTLFGILGVFTLTRAIRPYTSKISLGLFIAVIALCPLFFAYQHIVLSEISSFFSLSLIYYYILKKDALVERYWTSFQLGAVLIASYYFRAPLFYVGLAAGCFYILRLTSNSLRQQKLNNCLSFKHLTKALLGHFTLILIIPFLLTRPWDKQITADRKLELLLHSIAFNAVVSPEHPAFAGIKDQYQAQINAEIEPGIRPKVLTGNETYAYRHRLIEYYKIHKNYYLEIITGNPIRYFRAVARSLAILVGVPTNLSENAIFTENLFRNHGNSVIFSGPPDITKRMTEEFTSHVSTPAFSKHFVRLNSIYIFAGFIGFLLSFWYFFLGTLSKDLDLIAITLIPVIYISVHAILTMGIDRYSVPVFPFALLNFFILGKRSIVHLNNSN